MNLSKIIADWKLYVITDNNMSGLSHLQIARDTITGGTKVVQLRDKYASSRKLYDTGLQLRKLTRMTGTTLIINDRLDIALACKADGLHVGQDDLPASTARKLLGQNKILGVSATSLQQAISAEEQGADYIGVGPIFDAKSTKPDAEPAIGVDLLREIKLKCTVPIVAIGGIKLDNIADVFQHGADCIAIISAIVASSNITQTTRDFIAKIKSLG